jgi:hypothetical protein
MDYNMRTNVLFVWWLAFSFGFVVLFWGVVLLAFGFVSF